MKLWLSKNGEIPLREQITRQVMLAITSGDLRAGEKLPSVREVALRYDVHPNTVSAAYRWLESNGWVLSKRGSGVFVRARILEDKGETSLDSLISEFFQTARQKGFSSAQIEARLRERLLRPLIEKIIVVEPDAELNRILTEEISDAVDLEVVPFGKARDFHRAIAVAINETEARQLLPATVRFLRLQLNSAQNAMRGKQRPEAFELIGVTSRLETFLRWSNTMLLAAGIKTEQIVLRDAREANWQKGLIECRFVISDSLTAKQLPKNWDVRVFRLISDYSLAELESLIG